MDMLVNQDPWIWHPKTRHQEIDTKGANDVQLTVHALAMAAEKTPQNHKALETVNYSRKIPPGGIRTLKHGSWQIQEINLEQETMGIIERESLV